MPREKVYYAEPAEIHISLEEVPEHEIDYMCRTISAAVHRLLQDPKNKENFEQWRKARAGVKT